MFLHVNEAEYIKDYLVKVKFNDGCEGLIDFKDELYGELFEPIKDLYYFQSFKIERHTITWENGADFAPEYLREITQKLVF